MSLLNYFGVSHSNKRTSEAVANIEETVQVNQDNNNNKGNAKYSRKFNNKWKNGRDWLVFENDLMKCKLCIDYYRNLGRPCQGKNKFLEGSNNFKLSAVLDHEQSNAHKRAVEISKAKALPTENTTAGKTYIILKQAERHRISNLFRNVHAVVKNNRPLGDYVWLCQLDKTKGVDIGETYVNESAATKLIKFLSDAERKKTRDLVEKCDFYSIMMDGSTDITGDEQEAVYIRISCQGKVTERFLCIGTPKNTCAVDLKDFVIKSISDADIPLDKLIGLGSDGASNMVGVRGGLATLLRNEVNPELHNVHCFAHRLELSFRDVLKKNNLYDKLTTLLIGLHYFYIKQYKNKRGLLNTMDMLGIKGVLPPKITGTRWLPHLSRGIAAFLRTYKAYEVHLADLSHSNPKAEGLYKIMLNKNLMCFTLFLKEVLDLLMKLSLKLQQPATTLGQCISWVECHKELLEEFKEWDPDLHSTLPEQLQELCRSGKYQDVSLKGKTSMSYIQPIVDGMKEALESRFDLNSKSESAKMVEAAKLLHFKNWPSPDSSDIKDFGNDEIVSAYTHFRSTLRKACEGIGNGVEDGDIAMDFGVDEFLKEWKVLKKVLYKSHGANLQKMEWCNLYDREQFPFMMKLIDLLSSIPPTSVSCETTFSQMKLVKTCRRARLSSRTLNSLLLVKLCSLQERIFP